MVVPTYSNTNMDRVSGVAFIYLSFEDNNLILSSEKTKILENLNKSIDNLTDIIQNDKCNFDAKWKTNSNKYFCTPNPGHITATGGLNDTCAKL